MTQTTEPRPDGWELLLAERDIQRVLYQYCRGVDRLDRDLVRSCYHDDAVDEHGSFTGGVDAYVDWAFGLLRRYTSTMHVLANILIDVVGEVALAESYGIAHHRTDGSPDAFDPKGNLITGFRFVDRFERRAGKWRIARRVATTEWSRVDDLDGRWNVPDRLRTGARDGNDPVYWLVPEAVRSPR